MAVRNHLPEAAQVGGRDADAEGGNVTLQMGVNELFTPLERIAVRVCRHAGREPTLQPQLLQCIEWRLYFVQRQRCQLKIKLACFPKKGTMPDMNNISIADILGLPVQERIRLVELIWDSVAAVPEAVEISPALKAELEARLVEFEANPEAGYSWEQVRSCLKDGTWRTA